MGVPHPARSEEGNWPLCNVRGLAISIRGVTGGSLAISSRVA
jgi:hypothetical protein